ncbi:MAG: aldo/keto reductase [bacterium]|nr:aldo/keto reductase [Deltaproteobacteria bacterium]MCP4904318.1 aldo/keto reductase [bacterium]
MILPRQRFGGTGFEATRLGFGAMELMRTGGPSSIQEAGRLLNEVLDQGINLIDTSPDYATSEELIGESIAHRREEYFLASKCGCLVGREPRFEGGKLEHDFSPANIRAGVEQSLRRLKTDRLDLVQIHSSPSRARIESEGSVEAMVALRDEGKVRFLGMSSTLPDLEDHIEMGVFDSFQIPYSALQPEHDGAICRAAAAGAATIIRGGVARGATASDYDESGAHEFWRGFVAERRTLWERARLDEILGELSPMEFMLRFVLSHPYVDTTIVGTSKSAHLVANVAVAARGPLPEEIVSEAKRRISKASG